MSLKKQALLKLMQSKPYEYLLLHVFPRIRFSTQYAKLEGWQFQRAYEILQPGDIVLTFDGARLPSILVSKLTDGHFSHATLCIGKGCQYEIAEMIHVGYQEVTFYDICKEADRIAIIRCWDFDYRYINNILIPTCRNFKGTPYDTLFLYGVKTLYCSELPISADKEKRLIYNDSDLAGLGRRYAAPDDLYHILNGGPVYDSNYDKKLKNIFSKVEKYK